jgi:hypothetical protein
MMTTGGPRPSQRRPRTARLIVLGGAVVAVLGMVLVGGRVINMPATISPGTISLDGPVIKMIFDPRTRHLFILYQHEDKPISCGTPAVPAGGVRSAVRVIDTTRHALLRTVELGPAMDITEDQATGHIVIAESTLSSLCSGPAGHILILDTASGRVLHTTTTTDPCLQVMMNPVTGHILSSCGVFDGRSGRALYSGPDAFPILIDATTRHAFGIAAASRTGGTTLAMVGAAGGGPLLRLVTLPATGDYITAVTVAPARAVVVGWDQPYNVAVRVHILDTRTGTVLRSVVLRNRGLQFESQPPTLLFDALTAHLVVFARLSSSNNCMSGFPCSAPPPATAVFVLDANSGRQIAEFTRVLPPPVDTPSMALDRRRGLVLLPIAAAANAGQNGSLELLSTRSGAVERTIPVQGIPKLVVEDETSGRAFVATWANRVSVVDIRH